MHLNSKTRKLSKYWWWINIIYLWEHSFLTFSPLRKKSKCQNFLKSAKIRRMQNQLITQTASGQFQSAIVNNHAEHPGWSRWTGLLLSRIPLLWCCSRARFKNRSKVFWWRSRDINEEVMLSDRIDNLSATIPFLALIQSINKVKMQRKV